MYYTEDGEMVEILPETTLTAPDPENSPGIFQITENYPELIVGTTYKVKWNGVEYAGTATDGTGADEGSVILINDGTDLNTGEGLVFAIAYVAGVGCTFADPSGANELTASIYSSKGEKIHHIPPKYIKDMYYEEETYGEIVPPTTAIDNGYAEMGEFYVMGPPITLVVGKTYTVHYNGVDYECVATAGELLGESIIAMGDLAVLTTGAPSGAYPFVMATGAFAETAGASIAVIGLDGSASITVAIYGDKTEIHGIPQKYIDGFAPMYVGDRLALTTTDTRITDTNLINFLVANKDAKKVRIRVSISADTNGILKFQRQTGDLYQLLYASIYGWGAGKLSIAKLSVCSDDYDDNIAYGVIINLS
jgi:hypothetical protein